MVGFYGSARPHYGTVRADTRSMSDSKDAMEARIAVDKLTGDVERLLMITEAFWGILKKQHGYTDDDLAEMITEIDLRDGKLDGRVSNKSEPRQCPNCDRVIMRNRAQCLYCGTEAPDLSAPFER